jgi:hypothetical protein
MLNKGLWFSIQFEGAVMIRKSNRGVLAVCLNHIVSGCVFIGAGALFGAHRDIEMYEKAVKVAETLRPVSYKLLAIIPGKNEHTIWNKDATKVLVSTWIPHAYVDQYRKSIGHEFITSDAFDMWVTLVPQVKVFCENFNDKMGGVTCKGLKNRVNQFLGLPPLHYGKNPKKEYNEYFVEFWVKPEYLFRPCLNPDVTSIYCTTDPRLARYSTWNIEEMFKLAQTPLWHQEWFRENIKKSYPHVPWTRLGYTYDWNFASEDHTGATEFVVKTTSPIEISGVYQFDKYCSCSNESVKVGERAG